MNDEKFEKIMENWAAREMESTPQLRPKKAMYQLLKAKKRKVFFPGFIRWATVATAAVCILFVVILHRPDIFRAPTSRERTAQTEDLSVGQQKAQEVEVSEEVGNVAEPQEEEELPAGRRAKKASEDAKEGFVQPPKVERAVARQRENVAKRDIFIPDTTGEMDKLAGVEPSSEKQALQYRREAEPEATLHEEGELAAARPPSPTLAESLPVAVDEQTVQPVSTPAFFEAKSKTNSESRKTNILSTRAAVPSRSIEKGSDADDVLYDNEQAPVPEPSIAGKDRADGRVGFKNFQAALKEKKVGSKTFRLQDGIWVDLEHFQEKEIIKIKRDSLAYHDLITALPELKAYFKIGQNMIVNVGEFSITIADNGKAELTEVELKNLVRK